MEGYFSRRVVFEMGGVNHNPADNTGEGEPEDNVIAPTVAPPPGLPALAHGPGPAGAVEHRCRRVEVITAGHDSAAVFLAGEIDGQCLQPARVGHHAAGHAEPCYPAIREDRQADVREAARIRGLEHVVLIAA